MSVVVFTGSTLTADEVRAVVGGADVRPPAAFGDVYRAARERPRAIAIIDGLFQYTPAVWHKEILWAMSEGVRVLGAASMGALRAAELAPFGMEGVGEIFAAFLSGELEDDDEVAVAHAPAEQGWRALSEAMVDLRATLRAAAAAGVLEAELVAPLTALAKKRFYAERSMERLLRDAAEEGLPPEPLQALRDWLPTGRVRQKRADALALLERLRAVDGPAPAPAPGFAFEHTDAWEDARRRAERGERAAGLSSDEALVEELQLAGVFGAIRDGALVRGRAIEETRRRGIAVDEETLRATIERFRLERELRQPEEFERWLADEGLRGEEGVRFFRDEAMARLGRIAFEHDAARYIVDHLRATGDRLHFSERARIKRELLGERGLEQLAPADAGISETELWRWFFETQLGRSVPRDLRAWAVATGFDDERALKSAVLREHMFRRLRPD